MDLVIYNINGKFFNYPGNPFGAYVQSSEGLFSELKPKARTQYDWQDQHGFQVSTKRPFYNPREITLKGWIEGSGWEDLKQKFDSLFGEFRKSGKQRLEIQPFGVKPLVYEVLTFEEIRFDKKFRKGEMIGFFTLELVEVNPVKKVYKAPLGLLTMDIVLERDTVLEVNIGNNSAILGNPIHISQTLKTRTIQGNPPLTPSPSDYHFITVAGDIDSITSINTNANLIWERL